MLQAPQEPGSSMWKPISARRLDIAGMPPSAPFIDIFCTCITYFDDPSCPSSTTVQEWPWKPGMSSLLRSCVTSMRTWHQQQGILWSQSFTQKTSTPRNWKSAAAAPAVRTVASSPNSTAQEFQEQTRMCTSMPFPSIHKTPARVHAT